MKAHSVHVHVPGHISVVAILVHVHEAAKTLYKPTLHHTKTHLKRNKMDQAVSIS